MPTPSQEIARRRTFAIISHPDAGKTTLTEKFLLYGNALHLAGSVTARKNQRATASDWMELEKQRGISITSTVLQFDYSGSTINLLDTPGHQDFSEDTYRVLTAVDAAKAKLVSSELQIAAADLGVQLHGGAGYMDEYPVSRMYTAARVSRIYAGSSEVMKIIISRDCLGDDYTPFNTRNF